MLGGRTGVRSLLRIALTVVALIGAGCGTRRAHSDVVTAAAGVTVATGGSGPQANDTLSPTASGGAAPSGSGSPSGTTAAGASTGAGATPSNGLTPSGGGVPGGTGSSNVQIAKSRITIGVVGTLSGVAGASLAPQADGVRVWARWINDRGGVNGHPVDVVTGDDGGDPSRHQALVQEFVEQKHVVAFVGNPEALTGQASVDYLTKAGVADIGSDGAGQWFYQSPVYFPQGSHGDALAQSVALGVSGVAKRAGLARVATITCVEAQVCRDSYGKAKATYARYGLQLVYQAQDSLGQPDFTSECLNAKNAGAQLISTGMDANSVKNIARSCSRQGYHPIIQLTSGSSSVDLKDDVDLDGTIVTSIVGPWVGSGTPSLKEFQDAMAKYAPGTQISGGDMMGWVSAKVFELGARQLADPATPKGLLDGLRMIHGDVLPDLTGPLLYNQGLPATPTVCGFVVVIKNKQWTSDAQRSCGTYDPSL